MAKHHGSCHCGAVQYDVEADLSQPVACNCSMCGRSGTLLVFVPKEAFELKSGEDALTDYQFGSKTIHHTFCSTCGIKSFARGTGPDGSEMVAINIRCLDGVDVRNVQPHWYDGKAM